MNTAQYSKHHLPTCLHGLTERRTNIDGRAIYPEPVITSCDCPTVTHVAPSAPALATQRVADAPRYYRRRYPAPPPPPSGPTSSAARQRPAARPSRPPTQRYASYYARGSNAASGRGSAASSPYRSETPPAGRRYYHHPCGPDAYATDTQCADGAGSDGGDTDSYNCYYYPYESDGSAAADDEIDELDDDLLRALDLIRRNTDRYRADSYGNDVVHPEVVPRTTVVTPCERRVSPLPGPTDIPVVPPLDLAPPSYLQFPERHQQTQPHPWVDGGAAQPPLPPQPPSYSESYGAFPSPPAGDAHAAACVPPPPLPPYSDSNAHADLYTGAPDVPQTARPHDAAAAPSESLRGVGGAPPAAGACTPQEHEFFGRCGFLYCRRCGTPLETAAARAGERSPLALVFAGPGRCPASHVQKRYSDGELPRFCFLCGAALAAPAGGNGEANTTAPRPSLLEAMTAPAAPVGPPPSTHPSSSFSSSSSPIVRKYAAQTLEDARAADVVIESRLSRSGQQLKLPTAAAQPNSCPCGLRDCLLCERSEDAGRQGCSTPCQSRSCRCRCCCCCVGGKGESGDTYGPAVTIIHNHY